MIHSTTSVPTVSPSNNASPLAPATVQARSRWRRILSIVLPAVAVSLGLGFGLLRSATGGGASAPPPPDVPHAEGKVIVFSRAFAERAGIRTAVARRAELVPRIEVGGTVTFDPEHVAAVGTRIRGLVRRLAKIEGDRVKEGEVLAEIESGELGEAQATVSTLMAQRRAAELNAARERDLLAQRLSTAREAEVAEASLQEHIALLAAAQQKVTALGGATGGALGVYVLRAPLSGTVVERHIAAGQSVEGHLTAYKVADLDHLWVELAVYEKSLGSLHCGNAVEIRAVADPSRALAGSVAHVGDALDPLTHSAPVRIKIDNRERRLRPGQAVTATIHASGQPVGTRTALLVPSTAVTWIDGKPTLFLADAEERVVPTPVTLGATNGADQEILEGLAEGATVVSQGVFALKSELYR